MSPASKTYLDMKYDTATAAGAELGRVRRGADSRTSGIPSTLVDRACSRHNIIGVEAPLWSETALTLDDIEYMAFPRLPGINEIGWSPAAGAQLGRVPDCGSPRTRPGSSMMGIEYYRSPQVVWGQ